MLENCTAQSKQILSFSVESVDYQSYLAKDRIAMRRL